MEAENIPPAKDDKKTLAPPPKSKRPLGERNTETNVDTNVANGSLIKPQTFPPSPSKRKSSSSHYDDDVECNPRKKAKVKSDFAAGKTVMKNNTSGFLFGPSAAIRKEVTDSDEEEPRDTSEPPRRMAKANSQPPTTLPSLGRAKVVLELPQGSMTTLRIQTQFQRDDLRSDDGGPPYSQSSALLDEGWSEGSECEVNDLLANVSTRSALSDIKGDSTRNPICIDL
jgi:hypothetical protein